MTEDAERRAIFLKIAFGEDNEGYICIARRERNSATFIEEFFHWPDQAAAINDHVERFLGHNDLWYCPQLLSRKARKKDAVVLCPSAWADLDSCEPSKMLVRPNIVIESSPNRFQALWRFPTPLAPLDAEDISRRIAYHHADEGCDKSGWDLTQLLRVPFTFNQKYAGDGDPPLVKIIDTHGEPCLIEQFEVYPTLEAFKAFMTAAMPETVEDAADVLMRYRSKLHPMVFVLYSQQPKQDWSKALWSLELLCFECGLSVEETYAVCIDAACNKYERDHRGTETMWKEVVRAYEYHAQDSYDAGGISKHFDGLDPILTDVQRALVIADDTIIERYITWATSLGDASAQYHQAGAFTILSALLAGNVRIPTSFGTVTPNLWFMILADTTLTRKTTAMDIAMALLGDIDPNSILATDGSIEGLFSAMSMRPGRPSIFLRDEFSGLLEAMTKKDYMAGMGESLTKLYDGKFQKRILKRETIEVKDPVLLLFAGGIRSRIFELLNYDHVISGFLPRFIFITADADITKMKPVGPPTIKNNKERDQLEAELQKLYEYYNTTETTIIDGKVTVTLPKRWNVELTEDAWLLYNMFETNLVNQGLNHAQRDVMMPSLDRLAKSGLKVSALIASCRCIGLQKITVTELDILHAFYYVEVWRDYLLEVLENINKSSYEKLLDLISGAIAKEPGIARGTIMRLYHLSARTADDVLKTLEERYLLTRVKNGRTERLYPPDSKGADVIHVNFQQQ